MNGLYGESYRRGDLCFPNFPGFAKNLEDMQSFVPEELDFLLCSYPKSGAHWVYEMINLILSDNPTEYMKEGLLNLEVFGVEVAKSKPSPRVLCSHLPFDFLPANLQAAKIVYVMRNPKDQIVSYFYHYQAMHQTKKLPWTDFVDYMLCSDEVEYGSWTRNALQWWKACRDRTNVLFLFYEDILEDHEGAVRKLCSFMGRDRTDEQIRKIVDMTSFKSMKSDKKFPELYDAIFSKDYSLCRSGKVGEWRTHFTEEQNQAFKDKYYGEMMLVDGLPEIYTS